jgi:uncharacterized protein (TIGR03435 family)
MKRDQLFRSFIKRAFAPFLNAPEADVDAACDRVLQRLQEGPVEEHFELVPSRPWRFRWPAVALVSALVTLAIFLPTTVLRSAPAVLEEATGSREIQFGEMVRGGTLKLPDGSRVEIRVQSEVWLEKSPEGVQLRLSKGQMAVLSGEAKVQQGNTNRTLRAGEQVQAPPPPPEPRIAFEEASIRLNANAQPTGQRGLGGGGGGRRRNPRPAGEPCGSDGEPQLNPRRFSATETTVHAMIAWAYGLDCQIWRGSDLLFGGPQWTKDDGYEIQALIPEGTPSYTNSQFNDHKAPELQKMLQTLLAERFKLVLRRETREMPVYVLSVAKGGPRMIPSPVGKKADVNMITLPNGNVVRGPGFGPDHKPGLSIWKDGDDDCCIGITPEGFTGVKQSIGDLAGNLSWVLGRPVLDRTGLTGEFNFMTTFERQYPAGLPAPSGVAPRPGADTRSPFTAIEQDLGLKLESTKEKIEVFVIDRIERPTEN